MEDTAKKNKSYVKAGKNMTTRKAIRVLQSSVSLKDSFYMYIIIEVWPSNWRKRKGY